MYKILAKTLFLGKQVFYMPTCHSTNDIAAEMLEKPDTQEGTVIITDNQTSGKGQRGNVWKSESGANLTFSVILKPSTLQIKKQFNLNIMVSLAVADVLKEVLPSANVKVKWPNDVLVNEKKVAGILIENTLKPPFLEYSVVGVGLNVNQEQFGDLRATSLKLISGRGFDLQDVFEKLGFALERRYLQLKSGGFDQLKTDYLASLYGFEQKRKFYSEYEFEGTIQGISEEGKLLVRTNQSIEEFDLKEITFL